MTVLMLMGYMRNLECSINTNHSFMTNANIQIEILTFFTQGFHSLSIIYPLVPSHLQEIFSWVPRQPPLSLAQAHGEPPPLYPQCSPCQEVSHCQALSPPSPSHLPLVACPYHQLLGANRCLPSLVPHLSPCPKPGASLHKQGPWVLQVGANPPWPILSSLAHSP